MSSRLSFVDFLLFSGEDFGDDLVDVVNAALFLFSFRAGFDREPFVLAVDLVDGLVFIKDWLRSGGNELLVSSSSSSESTAVDLRCRFAGRSEDMVRPDHHFGSALVCEREPSEAFKAGSNVQASTEDVRDTGPEV